MPALVSSIDHRSASRFRSLHPSAPQRRLKPLAACLAAALALGAGNALAAQHGAQLLPRFGAAVETPERAAAAAWWAAGHRPAASRPAGTTVVTSCDDAGPGTLRDAVQNAVDGDTIDLTQLSCGTITLTTGEIVVEMDHLTLQGPGRDALTIDGGHSSRLFDFWGGYGAYVQPALFALNDLTLTNGFKGGISFGGCVYGLSLNPNAIIALTRSTVTGCTIGDETSRLADGGGVYTRGSLALYSSTVSNNVATIGPGGSQSGFGGAGAVYTITVEDSTVTGNRAEVADAGGSSLVGGIGGMGGVPPNSYFEPRSSTIVRSTISNNYATAGGGLFFNAPLGYTVTVTPTVSDSTISGNTSATSTGVYATSYFANAAVFLTIQSSTIAFNSATGNGCGGIVSNGNAPIGVDLESTIVADNTGPSGIAADVCGTATMSGANNLVMASALPLPADTLSGDPLLAPLADNGGPTFTHALLAGSPAIDAGNNIAALDTDQRGAGYARVVGPAADIGAFEVQNKPVPPTLAATFTPDTIVAGGVSTLTIIMGNPNGNDATLTAALTDALPSSMVVTDPPATSTDCGNGSVTAVAGASSVVLAAGASIPAFTTCEVTVAVTVPAAGSYVDTIAAGALQTDAGVNADDASATLTVTPPVDTDTIFADGFELPAGR